MTRVAVIGDSHVVALQRAAVRGDRNYRAEVDGVDFRFGKLTSFPKLLKPFFQERADGVALSDAEMADRYARVIGDGPVAKDDGALFVISMAYTTTIFVRSTLWSRFRPWSAREAGMQGLSDQAIAAMAGGHFEHIVGFFAELKASGANVAAMEAPPPRRDEPCIGDTISAEALLVVDRIAREAVARRLAEMGVATIAAPEQGYDGAPRGSFLKESFHETREGDHHHANEAFGRLHIARIIEFSRLYS